MGIEALVGYTIDRIEGGIGDSELTFIMYDGRRYRMYHDQDCCESVYLLDVVGDMQDLVGLPVLEANEESSEVDPEGAVPSSQGSFTWTFYEFVTFKGRVTLRWHGSSNGYYSERVNFAEVLQ